MASFVYVPGLAVPEQVCRQAKTPDAFKAKINNVFSEDSYMKKMVPVILNKGARPLDCAQSLQWLSIPKPPPPPKPTHRRTNAITSMSEMRAAPPKTGMAKAFQVLGPMSTNVLSLQEGVKAEPMHMSVGLTLTPCSAPEYIAQPMPSSYKTKALAAVGRGDTLYIVGHSNAQGGSLTYKLPAPGHIVRDHQNPAGCDGWQHCQKRHIDPVTLASLLVNEGLPAGTSFDIALVACYSGGLDSEELQTVQCFAQRLAGALGGRGYSCKVFGATGLTSVSDKNEYQVAKGATRKDDGTILLDPSTTEVQTDAKWTPFYQRFFRFYRA